MAVMARREADTPLSGRVEMVSDAYRQRYQRPASPSSQLISPCHHPSSEPVRFRRIQPALPAQHHDPALRSQRRTNPTHPIPSAHRHDKMVCRHGSAGFDCHDMALSGCRRLQLRRALEGNQLNGCPLSPTVIAQAPPWGSPGLAPTFPDTRRRRKDPRHQTPKHASLFRPRRSRQRREPVPADLQPHLGMGNQIAVPLRIPVTAPARRQDDKPIAMLAVDQWRRTRVA